MRSHHLPYNDCNDLFIMHFQIVFCSLISANSVFVYKIHFPKTPKIKQRLITWLECLLAMWDFSFWLDFALFSVSLGTSNIAYTAFVVLCVCVLYAFFTQFSNVFFFVVTVVGNVGVHLLHLFVYLDAFFVSFVSFYFLGGLRCNSVYTRCVYMNRAL